VDLFFHTYTTWQYAYHVLPPWNPGSLALIFELLWINVALVFSINLISEVLPSKNPDNSDLFNENIVSGSHKTELSS
jgi:hypothetical protein